MTSYGLEALRAIHLDEVSPVLHSLTAEEWAAPSACAGWRTQDVVAHITTNMKLFVDPDPQPDDGGEPPGIEAMQDALVDARRDWSSEQILAEYDQLLEPWLGAVAMFQDEPMASAETDLGQLGTHPMHRFADIYAFDHLCHLRVDLLAPGGSVARDLPPVDDLRMRPSVEWMMAGLPDMCRDALAVVTAPVQLELTGPGASTWLIGPGPEVHAGAGEAAATVTSSAEDFIRWGTKRGDWRQYCEVTGDHALAAATLDAIDII
ncbi:MAG: maleylpyruvate isomerase family mycothiol-dependent enzyme [Acidimicrobiia bacterium]|nr:maleylpyruvate isomerase family mycothiol-dependent enzyme [Acidimicrobiia bacterium]MDH5238067.1 maleylpyruvate isomerase family mycothiol-dependent enzyme [Acidimicrobiia bacterium]